MAKKPKTEVEDEVVETEEVEEAIEAPKAAKSNKTEVTVTWRGNSRVYSKAVHGENFLDLAKEFAEKKDGTVA